MNARRVITVSALMLVLASVLPLSAQPLPPEPFPEPSLAESIAEIQPMAIKYRIAMIADPDSVAIDLEARNLAPDFLQSTFGIDTYDSISAFVSGEVERPDGLILIGDIWRGFNTDNVAWLRDAYYRGTVLGIVNVTSDDVRALMGLNCRDIRLVEYKYPDEDHYAVMTFSAHTVLESDRQRVIEAYQQCKDEDAADLVGPLSLGLGSGANTLMHTLAGVELVGSVVGQIASNQEGQFSEEERQSVLDWLGIDGE